MKTLAELKEILWKKATRMVGRKEQLAFIVYFTMKMMTLEQCKCIVRYRGPQKLIDKYILMSFKFDHDLLSKWFSTFQTILQPKVLLTSLYTEYR